jgi:hypothetical protein
MKLLDYVRAHLKLAFYILEPSDAVVDKECIRTIIRRQARGNVSLTTGIFTTQAERDARVEMLRGFRFNS